MTAGIIKQVALLEGRIASDLVSNLKAIRLSAEAKHRINQFHGSGVPPAATADKGG